MINSYQQYGQDGPVLVFLHYFGGAADSWQYVVAALKDDYRCICLNLPGFGGTPPLEKVSLAGMSRWVRAELRHLQLTEVTLIGHSMGGKIAVQVAIDEPDRIARLILVAPSPPSVEPMPESEKVRMLNHPDREEATRTVDGAIERTITSEQRQLAIETQLIVDPATWVWWIREGMNNDISQRAAQLTLPVRVLAATDDPAIPFETIQEEVVPYLQNSELITIDGVGHLLPFEVVEWVADQISGFVSSEA